MDRATRRLMAAPSASLEIDPQGDPLAARRPGSEDRVRRHLEGLLSPYRRPLHRPATYWTWTYLGYHSARHLQELRSGQAISGHVGQSAIGVVAVSHCSTGAAPPADRPVVTPGGRFAGRVYGGGGIGRPVPSGRGVSSPPGNARRADRSLPAICV